ncbi:MAG: family 10 glycosylhydrolase [Planctomycetes bacterium]|nr:family 10 glycosylhydrolase [Planctomycetota bacterium]
MLRTLLSALFAAILGAACCAQDIVIDNGAAGFSQLTGTWTAGSSAGYYGSGYLFASSAASATATVEWRPAIPTTGSYEVAVWYVSGANRSDNAPFAITHAGGTSNVAVNQQINGSTWRVLGTYTFNAGSAGRVLLGNNANPSVVIADAVRFRPIAAAADEFRGVWVSRFEWPSNTPSVWKSNIDTIMANAKLGNFNSVVLQMRGDTTTLYPSPNEPLSSLITLGTGDDPLRYALDAGHALGLKVHCYFNTHVCTSAFASAHQSWLIADATGTPQSATVDGYYWLAPGHPDVQQYLRTQVMYLVNTYPDLDGIHFDRIRMPEPQYSHDVVSEARRLGGANPDSLNFDDWTADQITRWLRDVYAHVHSINPALQLSAAPLGLYAASAYPGYSTGYYYGKPRHQDAKAWLAAGALDWIAPQCYWADGGSKPDFSDLVPDWLASASGRHIYPGMSASSDGSATETIAEITAARNLGAPGTVVWSYSAANSYNFWSALPAGVYAQPASPPLLSWLASPTKAIVYGYVTDFATGLPVTDAWITRSGSTYTALSAKDGFYCWLELTPGSYTLNGDLAGTGSATRQVLNLAAGEVRRVDLALANGGVAVALEFAGAPVSAEQGKSFNVIARVVDNSGALVTSGSYNLTLSIVGGSGTLAGVLSGTTVNGGTSFTVSYNVAEAITLQVTEGSAALTPANVGILITAPGASGGGGDSGGGGCSTAEDNSVLWLLALFWSALACRQCCWIRRHGSWRTIVVG